MKTEIRFCGEISILLLAVYVYVLFDSFLVTDRNLNAGTKSCCIPKPKKAKQKIRKKCSKLHAFTF